MTSPFARMPTYRPGALLRGTAATSTAMAIRLLSQAAMLVVVARTLGPADFALFIAIFALAVVIGGWVGLGSGYVLVSRAVSSENALREAWPVTLRVMLASSLVLALAFAPVAGIVIDRPLPIVVLLAVALADLLCQPLVYACSFAFQSREKFVASGLLLATGAMARAVGAISACLLMVDAGIEHVAIGIAIGAIMAARRISLRGSVRVIPLGIAMGVLVPLMVLVALALPIQAEVMPVPGANRSTQGPKLE